MYAFMLVAQGGFEILRALNKKEFYDNASDASFRSLSAGMIRSYISLTSRYPRRRCSFYLNHSLGELRSPNHRFRSGRRRTTVDVKR